MNTIPQHCVVAVYESFYQASEAINALDTSSIPHEQVSFITHNLSEDQLEENSLHFENRSLEGATKNAGVGGLLGMLLATPALMVSGIGPLVIAGPIAAGLGGAMFGGFLGAMHGWGLLQDDIEKYKNDVKNGNMLVVINGSQDQAEEAEKVLRKTNVQSVQLHKPRPTEGSQSG